MTSRPILGLTAVLAALALAGCGGGTDPVTTPGPSPITLTTQPLEGETDDTTAEPTQGATGEAAGVPGTAQPAGDCTETVTGTLDKDIIVSSGTTCIDGASVDGDILVSGGAAVIIDGARIDGNVQGDGHGAVTVTGGSVDGNIQLTNGGSAAVTGVDVDGDIQAERNTGAIEISGNTVDGNIQCDGNDPAPTGSGNRVEGNLEGQCAGL